MLDDEAGSPQKINLFNNLILNKKKQIMGRAEKSRAHLLFGDNK